MTIDQLRNVGPRNISRLYKLGIKTVKDLLWHFPVRYEDYTEIVPIADVEPGQKVNIQGEVLKISSKRIFPRRMSITNAIVGDESGAIKVVWFNQPYIENQLTEGTFISLAGKASLNQHGLYLSSPTYEKSGSVLKHTHGLVPVYSETEGVTSKYLRFLIKPLLDNIQVEDPLPSSLREKYNFPELSEALNSIHYPDELKKAEVAKERFAFEDLLLFQVKALLERRKMNQLKSISVPFEQDLIQDFIAGLPFELTTDQKVSLWEILKDLQKNYPMNRLMEGDVGSGKTVVALISAYQIAKKGYQTVFLVPTEVLAQQHYQTITSLMKDSSVSTGLLTGSDAKFNGHSTTKKDLKEKISLGNVQIVIGTHAVIQKDVSFDKLAMVVIDEQHRFGINQRASLVKNTELVPHLLSMTATPIPRTLSLTIYGDLDISLIKEKPKNRQKIITKIITPKDRTANYQFIREEVKRGQQVFVVCPRIELSDPKKEILSGGGRSEQAQSAVASEVGRGRAESKPPPSLRQSKMNILWADVKAVEEEYKKLSEDIFPELRVAMLHGKLKPKDKNEIMNKFKNKEFDILVSTSVIEVGVDIPNATIMAIESAERFGLAQLHQFRGRVGRGEHQSYCLLFSSTGDKTVNKRLKALVECDDGFELAEQDMKLRGPGEFFGVKQSGLPDLAMASLANVDLIKKARAEARALLKEDPSLKNYPLLRERLESFQKLIHFE